MTLREELLSAEDLRAARLATLRGDDNQMHDPGRKAVETLARLRRTDPIGFMEFRADMPKAERICVRFDKSSREWRITIPRPAGNVLRCRRAPWSGASVTCNLTPQPVWVNGKLVAPQGWISPETRELMRRATENTPALSAPQQAPETTPKVAASVDPWAPAVVGELR